MKLLDLTISNIYNKIQIGGCRLLIIGVMRFMKTLKQYYGKLWIDEVEVRENHYYVKERFIKDASFILNATSLKDALHVIKDKCVTLFGEDIIIGISVIYCNEKNIDWNYKNRVTYNDSELREKMWC